MGPVRIIPPNDLILTPTQPKVAVYCRISTNGLEQRTCLFLQEQYYEEWKARSFFWQWSALERSKKAVPKAEISNGGLRKALGTPESRYYQRICYGYTHDKDGWLVINEEEAQIIRLIYDMARKGESLSKISLRLKEMDIPSPQGDKERKDSEKRKIYR